MSDSNYIFSYKNEKNQTFIKYYTDLVLNGHQESGNHTIYADTVTFIDDVYLNGNLTLYARKIIIKKPLTIFGNPNKYQGKKGLKGAKGDKKNDYNGYNGDPGRNGSHAYSVDLISSEITGEKLFIDCSGYSGERGLPGGDGATPPNGKHFDDTSLTKKCNSLIEILNNNSSVAKSRKEMKKHGFYLLVSDDYLTKFDYLAAREGGLGEAGKKGGNAGRNGRAGQSGNGGTISISTPNKSEFNVQYNVSSPLQETFALSHNAAPAQGSKAGKSGLNFYITAHIMFGNNFSWGNSDSQVIEDHIYNDGVMKKIVTIDDDNPGQPYKKTVKDLFVEKDKLKKYYINNASDGKQGDNVSFWLKTKNKDWGKSSKLALNDQGGLVEVHVSQENELWYHVGNLSSDGLQVQWGKSIKYDTGTSNSIALDNYGNCIEVHHHGTPTTHKLYYRVGKVDFKDQKIQWGKSIEFTEGLIGSISMNDHGQCVAVHQQNNNLYYQIGELSNDQTIKWGKSTKYDTGTSNSISMDNHGNCIEVHHGSNKTNRLYYRVGKIDFKGQTIKWGKSTKYDTGTSNSTSMDNHGNCIEVHHSNNKTNKLYYRVGKIDFKGQTIKWGKSTKYDTGTHNSATLNGAGDALETHTSGSELHYNLHTGLGGFKGKSGTYSTKTFEQFEINDKNYEDTLFYFQVLTEVAKLYKRNGDFEQSAKINKWIINCCPEDLSLSFPKADQDQIKKFKDVSDFALKNLNSNNNFDDNKRVLSTDFNVVNNKVKETIEEAKNRFEKFQFYLDKDIKSKDKLRQLKSEQDEYSKTAKYLQNKLQTLLNQEDQIRATIKKFEEAMTSEEANLRDAKTRLSSAIQKKNQDEKIESTINFLTDTITFSFDIAGSLNSLRYAIKDKKLYYKLEDIKSKKKDIIDYNKRIKSNHGHILEFTTTLKEKYPKLDLELDKRNSKIFDTTKGLLMNGIKLANSKTLFEKSKASQLPAFPDNYFQSYYDAQAEMSLPEEQMVNLKKGKAEFFELFAPLTPNFKEARTAKKHFEIIYTYGEEKVKLLEKLKSARAMRYDIEFKLEQAEERVKYYEELHKKLEKNNSIDKETYLSMRYWSMCDRLVEIFRQQVLLYNIFTVNKSTPQCFSDNDKAFGSLVLNQGKYESFLDHMTTLASNCHDALVKAKQNEKKAQVQFSKDQPTVTFELNEADIKTMRSKNGFYLSLSTEDFIKEDLNSSEYNHKLISAYARITGLYSDNNEDKSILIKMTHSGLSEFYKYEKDKSQVHKKEEKYHLPVKSVRNSYVAQKCTDNGNATTTVVSTSGHKEKVEGNFCSPDDVVKEICYSPFTTWNFKIEDNLRDGLVNYNKDLKLSYSTDNPLTLNLYFDYSRRYFKDEEEFDETLWEKYQLSKKA